MAIKQAVTSVFKAKDEQSRVFNKMGKSADKFGEKGSRAFKKMSKSATSAGAVMKGVLGAGAVQKGLSLVSRGLSEVTTQFLDFDQAITSASAKFKGLDLTTKKGQKTLEALRKTARKVGAETEFNAAQAAGGLDFLALAGFNANQAMALLPGVTNLATVANVDLATATDIASDSLGAFGLMTSNTEQLTKNFTRVQDVMAKTTASSNTNLTDLFEAVQKGAPAFTAAGQSLESFNALAGVMANSGVKGSVAGIQLKTMMLKLAKPGDKATDILESLGVRTSDAAGNFRDIVDILADFEKGLKGLGTQQRATALATVFGDRAITGISIVLKEGTENVKSFRQMLIDSKGAAESMAKVMRSSLMNRLKSLGSAAIEVGFQLFSAFDKKGAGAIDALTQAVRKINLKPVTDGIKLFMTEIGKPVFDNFKMVVKDVWSFLEKSGIIETAGAAFEVLGKAIGPIGKSFKIMWRALKPLLDAFGTVLKPLMAGIKVVLDAIGLSLDSLDKRLDKTLKKFSAKNIHTSDFRKQERGEKLLREKTGFERSIDDKGTQSIKNLFNREKALQRARNAGANISERLGVSKFAAGRAEARRQGRLAIESDEFLGTGARKQPPRNDSTFKGTLDINGAPEGSTIKTDSRGPGNIDVKMQNRGKPVLQEAG